MVSGSGSEGGTFSSLQLMTGELRQGVVQVRNQTLTLLGPRVGRGRRHCASSVTLAYNERTVRYRRQERERFRGVVVEPLVQDVMMFACSCLPTVACRRLKHELN